MESPDRRLALWVIGPGRVGLALGLALQKAGALSALHYSGREPDPPDHPLFAGKSTAGYAAGVSAPAFVPDGVIIAVPDTDIESVAAMLGAGVPAVGVPVLHTSGARGVEALSPLATDHPVGSLHPLSAIADPVEGADRLNGSWFGIEGDLDARRFAERVVGFLGGRTLDVTAGAKPLYHAAAVLASNYVVALLDAAERLMAEAGAEPEEARSALTALASGAVQTVAGRGPIRALTGPISRGDAGTIELHLARLSPSDRLLYSVLARETLALATRGGLEPDLVARIQRSLDHAG